MYAKYYFDLRSLAEDNGLMFPNEYEPLTKERAKKLEVNGNIINGVPLFGASLSEPNTSVTALRKLCVCMYVCLSAAIYRKF